MNFYRRVQEAALRIPPGKVATYGQIALLCGKPRNSRQVGYALGSILTEKRLPAHRVVNHRGFLSGSQAFDHPDTQRILLEQEGVLVSADKQVDLKRYGWKNTMEEALWLHALFDRLDI